ncbi:MAG: TonB-dependent receptor [Sphingomonadales bacterium]|nr:MAG: TonB-dependent receptor [Sphingomonadales bacterium]
MPSLYPLSFCALPLILASPVCAQTTDSKAPDAETAGADIVVTGEGLDTAPSSIAYSTTQIERAAITAAPSGRIEDVLSSVAGFQQFRRSDSRSSNPSAQGATLRALGGNATSRALVLLDGVPMADPFFGYIPFSAIAPEQVSNIRVTRGGGSGPFGAGALAGTIELESADASTLGPFNASLLANGRGETEATASLAQDLAGGFGVISGRWDRGKGFFTTPSDQRVPATARARFDAWSIGLRGVAPLSPDIELQARALAFRDDRTLRFDGADSSSEGQDASVRIVGRGNWQFDALAYVQARNFSNIVISSTRFVRVLDQRNTPSTGLGGKLELRPPVGGDHTLRIGADYRHADGELQEEAYSAFSGNLTERRRAGGTNTNLGFFIEDDWRIGALILTGGLRADQTSIAEGFFRAVDSNGALVSEVIADKRTDWDISWRAGAALDASDRLRLRAAAYTGLRVPTLNELYRPFVVFPVVTNANSELRNERLEGIEAGVDIAPAQGVEISMTLFRNRVEDAIANVTLAPNLRQRQNLPAIEANGFEASANISRGKVRFNGSLAYTDAEVEGEGASFALDGNRPSQVPKWAASATIGWSPKSGWDLAATIRHIGAQFEDDQENDRLQAATTLSLFALIPLNPRLNLVLRGENLLNEEVITRNAGGSTDLGAPRTIWAGFRYGF